MKLDPELLEAFLPEFRAACAALADATEQRAAARAIDQLRAMAGALGEAGVKAGVEDAALLLDPFEPGLLPEAAAMLLARADMLAAAEAGEAAATETAMPKEPGLDAELLAAFLPEWLAALERLASAGDALAGQRALDVLAGLAGASGIASLTALLAGAPALLDPLDPPGLAALAERLAAQARAVVAAGRDSPPPEPAAPEPTRIRTPEPTRIRTPELTRIRTMIVDDSALMRRLVRETLLADPAFTVVGEAADGAEALRQMAALTPDLTMLDIEMPVLDGLGVLRAWALSGSGAVVIVSSAAQPASAVAIEARRLGAASVVGKPSGAFSPDLRDRQGQAIRRAARRAAGLPQEAA